MHIYDILLLLYSIGGTTMYEQIIKKYWGNIKALKIIESLRIVSDSWKGSNTFPISFYIADCDIEILEVILHDLGYPSPSLERVPIGRDLFCILVRLGG